MRVAGIFFLLSAILLSASGCSSFKFGWQREDNQRAEEGGEDIPLIEGPTNGYFDEAGNWHPNDPTIVSTYRIPDISSGFIADVSSILADKDNLSRVEFLSPSLQIELFEYDTDIPYIETLKLDFGVAYQRAYLYLGKLFTSIFEVSAGVYCGWNFETNELSYGIGATVIKF